MSFDRFLLAVESRDLSQADKSIKRVPSFPKLSDGYSRTSFSVSQQLWPEHSEKLVLSILSYLPLTRKTEKNVYFAILDIKLTKALILPNCRVPNSLFWYNCKFYCSKIEVL